TSAFSAGLPSFVSRCAQARSPFNSGTFALRACTSGRSRRKSSAFRYAGKRLAPRHFEYRFTNSHASRAYFETGWRPMCLMKLGMKHSLCLISIVSNAQPSESMPMRKSYFLAKRLSGLSDMRCYSEESEPHPAPRFPITDEAQGLQPRRGGRVQPGASAP